MGCERESCVGRADLDGRPMTQLSLGRFRFFMCYSPEPIGAKTCALPLGNSGGIKGPLE
jgi:hypothetical protein